MATTIAEPRPVGFARPLGGVEHLFSLIDRHRPIHFAMAAQIEGPASISAWRAALDQLQERHPMLSVAIEDPDGSAPHFRTVRNAPIPLRVTVGPTDSNWLTEIAHELATPFDAQRAPLARAVLMHGERESVFILTAHHAIADGLSAAYAIRDLMRHVAGEELEPLPPIPALEPLVSLALCAANGADDAQPEAPQAARAIGFRRPGSSLPRIEALQLTAAMTQSLRQRARREGTTVHGALSAALVLAGRESDAAWSGAPVRMMSPIDLRKEIGIGEDCGLYVWAAGISLDPQTPADFWDLARSAKSSLAPKQSFGRVATELQGLAHVMNSGIDVPGAAQAFAQVLPFDLLLTNLGKLPVPFGAGRLRLRALWGPAVQMGFEHEQAVGVATTGDALCLVHTSFTPIPSLLPRAAEILERACSNQSEPARLTATPRAATESSPQALRD